VTRKTAAGAAAAAVLALVFLAQPWSEVPRRLQALARFAPRELAVRRLGGSGTAFDRAFFAFLENARRRLPADARGVAIYGAPEAEPYLYLASYALAPRAVRMAPERLPPGWIAAIYGGGTPPGARIVAHWDGGTLAAPAP